VEGSEAESALERPPPHDEYSQVEPDPDRRRPSAAHPAGAPSDRGDGLVLEPEEGEPAPPRRRESPRIPARFETAADMERRLASIPGGRPAAVAAGQRVRHAEYGEGTVAGVSGTGPRSVATVTFDGPAGTRRVVLAHGAIEPA
jgi:hypothetical protein